MDRDIILNEVHLPTEVTLDGDRVWPTTWQYRIRHQVTPTGDYTMPVTQDEVELTFRFHGAQAKMMLQLINKQLIEGSI